MAHSTDVLGLLLILCIPFRAAIPLSSFYPYGSVAGDDVVPRGLDVSSDAIRLPTPFPFFGSLYANIYVSLCSVIYIEAIVGAYLLKLLDSQLHCTLKCWFNAQHAHVLTHLCESSGSSYM